jgi:hypothetical protein
MIKGRIFQKVKFVQRKKCDKFSTIITENMLKLQKSNIVHV